jgi:hypothetical protein
MKSLAIKVFFSIPFAAKRDDASWRRENDLFGHSLASVLNQTDSDLDVIVCGHDRPRCSQLDDPRVTFLSAPFPPPEDKSQFLTDKKRKRRETFNEIRRRGGGYVVLQDADDLVNRTLVDFIRQDRAPHGYIFRTGLVLDWATGNIAPVPGAWDAPFNRRCGTSAVFRFTVADLRKGLLEQRPYAWNYSAGHVRQEETAVAAGRPLSPLPFPGAIYVFNTGTNTSAQLSRDEAHMKAICKRIRLHRLDPEDAVLGDFPAPPVRGR